MKASNKKERLPYIDFLKVVGLTGIIIAHVSAPNVLFMLRSFDVPLMVIISSLLAVQSYDKYKNQKKGYLKYCWSRFKRLVIPTWIFLTLYFVIRAIITRKLQNANYYLDSYLLTRYGFGYVWVILIYLYSAILIPLFAKMRYSYKVWLIMLSVYLLYEICHYFKIGTDIKLIETTFYYIIPYGLLTFLGFSYDRMKNKTKYIIIGISLAIFIGLAIYNYLQTGSLQTVQIAKYPPRAYYLSYGIFCSFSLLLICPKIKQKYFKNKIINYISSHTMWIYLWHIFALEVYEMFKLPEIWVLKLLVVYITSMLIVLLVNKIIDAIEKKKKIKALIYLRG